MAAMEDMQATADTSQKHPAMEVRVKWYCTFLATFENRHYAGDQVYFLIQFQKNQWIFFITGTLKINIVFRKFQIPSHYNRTIANNKIQNLIGK